ncbi:hypothetical protein Salat_1749900 [Sesamum alatum]|uniref:BHLH domain-containing protein n=1 Tax=Sesamum alatum TaxID=300844 RepID=A0AAE1Y8C8_9LAMI|nr:hypothetical protein Salat_1749900 [Sesamum alatum]
MDEFFQLYNSPGSISWFETALLVDQSAFVRYTDQPFEGNGSNHRINVNKRMIEFLKRSRVAPVLIEIIEPEEDRIHKHRMEERMRREKHKQGYLALHKLLPLGTKSDKKSILEMAAKEMEVLQKYEKELKRQNRRMEMVLGARKNETAVEKAEIKLKVAYPASGVDSMLEVLRCLKHTGSTATAIQSSFSEHEFDAVLEIETKIRAQDVEKAVQRTLFEAERKFRYQL